MTATRASLPEQARRPLLEALLPLRAIQEEHARPLARKVAKALDIRNVKAVLNTGGLPQETAGVTALLRRASHAISRSSGKLDVALKFASFTGDDELACLSRRINTSGISTWTRRSPPPLNGCRELCPNLGDDGLRRAAYRGG